MTLGWRRTWRGTRRSNSASYLSPLQGYRLPPYGVRGRISPDCGATWGDEIVLRDNGDSLI